MAVKGSQEEVGPVQLPKGKVISKKWKIVAKLGEGGCGAVYKVENINSPTEFAALKAESNFVSGGSVLKLEVQILRRLEGRPHVAQLLAAGKKINYCYMVMTLLGDSLNNIMKKLNRHSTVSTQIRVGINTLYGIKQIHDIGFIHRDLKPANIAFGRKGTAECRFLHILDFGLAREYVVRENNQLKMRRPRTRALFRGTTRYCSIATHERKEQGRVDDLWSLLYMLAEMRGVLPWHAGETKNDIMEMKKATDPDTMLENSPVQLVEVAKYLATINYYNRPDYALIYGCFQAVMVCGGFKWTDPYDWEKKGAGVSMSCEKLEPASPPPPVLSGQPSKESIWASAEAVNLPLSVPDMATKNNKDKKGCIVFDPENPFPAEQFSLDALGF